MRRERFERTRERRRARIEAEPYTSMMIRKEMQKDLEEG